jgi:glycosyltransferase involved in cell wall biosynthesis
MRRLRSIRDMKNRAAIQRQAITGHTVSPLSIEPAKRHMTRTVRQEVPKKNPTKQPPVRMYPETLSYVDYDQYRYTSRPVSVCHVIESLGLGGAQTMMMELFRALNKYFGYCTKNVFVALSNDGNQFYNQEFFGSYGVKVEQCRRSDLASFCTRECIDIVVQHRIAISADISSLLPNHVRYVLINHTWNKMSALSSFGRCHAYVSVCEFLSKHSKWGSQKGSVYTTILNGVENDYVSDIPPASLDGTFRTGRCHRLIPSKFNKDSLPWLSSLSRFVPGFYHYLIGKHDGAKEICRTLENVKYFGYIHDLRQKMSIIKNLHLYLYETFGPEGASIAVLESLACGVPVLCNSFGGNPELIHNGVNGYVVETRKEFEEKIIEIAQPGAWEGLRASTVEDFGKRLHVKHAACRYAQLFERLIS